MQQQAAATDQLGYAVLNQRHAACTPHASGSPFERPSQMRLRGQLAVSLEAHWDKLEKLIDFGLSCSTRMARLALVRMLARMCGVGGGTSPQLGPAVSHCPALLLYLCTK